MGWITLPIIMVLLLLLALSCIGDALRRAEKEEKLNEGDDGTDRT